MMTNHSAASNTATGITRRQFVGTALAASAAVGAGAMIMAQQSATPKIKLGVVGCGGRGSMIAGMFKDHGGYEMHAVADYFQQVADACGDHLGVDKSRRFSGLSGYKKLIESGVQAVALETPPYCFPEHVKAAVDAGLHVYMAKPIAVDVAGTLQVEAAARKATAAKQVFLVDYQMPTDPFNAEAGKRAQDGSMGALHMVLSHYWGGLFPDTPKTANIESRLRHLTWCNDVALGGGYHVNACIHAVQAVLWAVGKVPVSAIGASSLARPNPNGDSHDVFSLTFKFDDHFQWTHVGKHLKRVDAPGESFVTCEFYSEQAYMRLGYSDRVLVRGGKSPYSGGMVQNLYHTGPVKNIATFHKNITEGNYANDTVRLAVDSALLTMLGREACLARREMTMEEFIRANKKYEADLSGLKA